ncbi:MAG: stage V sporulation protein AD [Lachnospiraceae bacterium]|nr:stage V sporulation protein AD [Lachnospiraceae bacterium]
MGKCDCNNQNKALGASSIMFGEPVRIMGSGSIVGQMENEGPLSGCFDKVSEDKNDMFGADSWEKAESELQKSAIAITLEKTGMSAKDIRYLFAGDLLGQNIASSFGVMDYNIPLFGLYGACSTCGESLSLGSMAIAGGFADTVISLTSSHFASAQKEFRFPLEYGGQRPLYASWTVTGSAGFLLQRNNVSNEMKTANSTFKNKICITGITTGRIEDFGIKDSFNMGCAMAPAAKWVIEGNLKDFGRTPCDYDAIFTGDLGNVGREALIKLLEDDDIDIRSRHYDCGMLIYDLEKQDVHAGGSGCGCSAVVLSSYILKKMDEGEWKRILFVPTGALLNKTSFNEGQNVPGIAHGIVIETID